MNPSIPLFNKYSIQNSGENFLDQQFWLYLYGVLVSSLGHIISVSNTLPSDHLQQVNTNTVLPLVETDY